jgi:hypothetical protein
MTNSNGNRVVTVRELADKLNGLRWEMRAYVLLIVLAALLRFEPPATHGAFKLIDHLF